MLKVAYQLSIVSDIDEDPSYALATFLSKLLCTSYHPSFEYFLNTIFHFSKAKESQFVLKTLLLLGEKLVAKACLSLKLHYDYQLIVSVSIFIYLQFKSNLQRAFEKHER